jgi:HSP20 family protein
MSEVQVHKGQGNPRRDASEVVRYGEGSFLFNRFLALSPLGLMREFTNEIDRVFHGFGNGGTEHGWSPAMDVEVRNGNLVVSAELPGLKREEVQVELTGDALIIEGHRKREHQDGQEGYYRCERSYGRFYRFLALPEGARTDQAKAELKDGVLRVTIPVPEIKQKIRQIPIEEGTKTPSSTM